VRSGDFKGNATVVRKRKMRRIGGSFWTPDRDENLRRLEGEGLSAGKIAEKLGTTRGSVIGRLHRLSGAAVTYPSYIRQANETRARNAARIAVAVAPGPARASCPTMHSAPCPTTNCCLSAGVTGSSPRSAPPGFGQIQPCSDRAWRNART
jgi:hypothetical protein